ncbi:putative disease resistance RPP13-like protein 1 [Telopea speciosissima]|uniref:putative disease resistance RPP13-like protein 1 n=1 Tax=Telopea speciosissima TaxID=54955 RepID=UPI001CC5D04B|nr:putative disease resistance RPP13-like protein 1 [Telopea speciosissima]
MSAMGQLIGGSFLSAFLQVAFDRFASPEIMEFLLRWKIDLDEVESLKRTSAMIQALADEAEVKQFTNGAVKLWLDHLKQLLYDAEDILDEYATELLSLKMESAHQTQQVSNPVPLTPSTESSVSSWLNSGMESAIKSINGTLEGIKGIGPKVYNIAEELPEIKRFGSKVREINQRLKSVAQEGVALGLNSSMGMMGFGSSRPMVFSQRPPTSSLVNTYKVFGQEEDMEKIVGSLLSDKAQCPSDNDNNFSVLPIVAMGGVGKTTLPQLVYNDVKVKKHFHLKAWLCVSEDFDVVRLTKEILESVTRSSPPNSLDLIQVKLQEALREKRFLLVLDDVWNKNYERWDAFSTAFAFGTPGIKILVTTRNKGVASIVRTVPKACFHGRKYL